MPLIIIPRHFHFLPPPIPTPNSPLKFPKPHSLLLFSLSNNIYNNNNNNNNSLLSPHLSHSSAPIFLPLLQQQEEQQQHSKQEEEEEEVAEDPIYRFFKSRTSTADLQDSQHDAKLTLRRNRHVSWHLASDHEFLLPEDTEQVDLTFKHNIIDEQQQEVKEERKDLQLPEGIIGNIIQIARNLPKNETLGGEVLKEYEGCVEKEECVEVLKYLGEEGRVFDCLYFFEWMRLQEPSSLVTCRACCVLFIVLGRARMGDELLVLFRNLPSTKEFRDVRVYNTAISGLLYCRRYEDAWKLYESMEHDNICPDHVTCSIVITLIRKLGHSAKDSWQFFEKMNRKGVKWSEEVLGALIKSFCDEGLIKEALIIQSEMETKGVSSNAIVYNTLIDAFCKSNYIEEAEGLFAEMKAKGIKPTESTFNILMYAYGRRMQPQVVEKLMVEMEEFGLSPDAKSYTCLISAYGKQKKMSDMAADAFLKMKKASIKPTSHSYTALIHAYSVSGWHEKAYMAFENMQREGLKPSIETYTALLDAFRRAGDTQTLMKIWKLMMRDKIEGTRVTFNTLLDGFAKQGHYVEARDVISEFGKIGLHPTVMTYNMLMNAYARGGQHSKLPQLLKEMANLNLTPDSITYSTMIYAYVRVRDFKRAFYYHKKMVKSGQIPDPESYKKLRAILDVKVAIKNKKDKSAILGIINSKMGMVKDKKKRKKDEFWKFKKPRTRQPSYGPSVPQGKP